MNNITKWLVGIVVSLVLVVAFVAYQYFSAEYLDEGSFLSTETMEPDSAIRIATMGDDLRLYEFTPKTLPGWQCIFVAGTNKGDTFCVPKGRTGYQQHTTKSTK